MGLAAAAVLGAEGTADMVVGAGGVAGLTAEDAGAAEVASGRVVVEAEVGVRRRGRLIAGVLF